MHRLWITGGKSLHTATAICGRIPGSHTQRRFVAAPLDVLDLCALDEEQLLVHVHVLPIPVGIAPRGGRAMVPPVNTSPASESMPNLGDAGKATEWRRIFSPAPLGPALGPPPRPPPALGRSPNPSQRRSFSSPPGRAKAQPAATRPIAEVKGRAE